MKFLLILLAAVAGTVLLHHRWKKIENKPVETKLFFQNSRLTKQGTVHFVFMCIQISFVITVFFSEPVTAYYYVLLGILFVYCIIIKFVRRVRVMSKAEAPFIWLGLAALVVRLLL